MARRVVVRPPLNVANIAVQTDTPLTKLTYTHLVRIPYWAMARSKPTRA